MAYETLVLTREERFAIITLDRPPANAISETLMRELNAALSDVEHDDAVRSVIVTGAGDKIFCAGADLGSAFQGADVGAFIRFGNSVVRRQLGIQLHGEGNLLELRQALYYCEDLYERIRIGKGRHYHAVDQVGSFLIVQDSTKHFSLHAVVEDDAAMARQFEKVVAMPVKYDMLYAGKWRQNLLLAERYQEGRVFMAGDAVHLVIPTGGLGYNTGVGDAIDLSWKLAATLQGWGGPALLRSYEVERRQVGGRRDGAVRLGIDDRCARVVFSDEAAELDIDAGARHRADRVGV